MKKILDFLTLLKDNNNKSWFDANKRDYSLSRNEFEALVKNLLIGLEKLDSGFAGLQPKDCMFRINRDVRFSADKSPYKVHFGAWFTKHGKNAIAPGYYFHLQPSQSFVAGGIYLPMSDSLKKIRQEIDYNENEWLSIVENEEFKKRFGKLDQEHKLKTKPAGYDLEHPLIEYLRLKSFTASYPIGDELLLKENLSEIILTAFGELKAFNVFLERALSEG